MSTVRLARFLARAGASSRRGAAELVASGRVRVNGALPSGPGDPVDPERDVVALDGRRLVTVPAAWLALHKPPGTETTRRVGGRWPSVFGLLPDQGGLVAVGRLDVMSEGLLLFTSDGDLAARLMHPRWRVPRVYRVGVTGRFGPRERQALERGVTVDDGPAVRPRSWSFTPDKTGGLLELELTEGRNRVVRNLCAALGLGVRRLARVAYGPVRLGDLAPGRVRPLTAREVSALYRAVELEQRDAGR